jgi:hypothetical protein
VGVAVLRRAVGTRVSAVRGAAVVALVGWLAAGALVWGTATGWPEALVAALGVLALQYGQLTRGERRWLGARLGLRGKEVGA